jgi:hypothetical protein
VVHDELHPHPPSPHRPPHLPHTAHKSRGGNSRPQPLARPAFVNSPFLNTTPPLPACSRLATPPPPSPRLPPSPNRRPPLPPPPARASTARPHHLDALSAPQPQARRQPTPVDPLPAPVPTHPALALSTHCSPSRLAPVPFPCFNGPPPSPPHARVVACRPPPFCSRTFNTRASDRRRPDLTGIYAFRFRYFVIRDTNAS